MSIDSSAANKRIAKNTLFLYLRTLVYLCVNLYTIRLLWRVLGVDNYGIYNVVGGIVFMFAFLNNAMVASSQRFLSFELGRGNKERLQRTFSVSVTVHVLLALIVLVLAETLGLWFLNYKMNIPPGRMGAANWVYQCSIAAFLLTVISVPYNACIVAHEHMKVFGYFGILEVILKLVIVLVVAALPLDRLITYSILVVAVSVVMRLIYGIYCSRHFEECHLIKFHDKSLMKEMFAFGGWSFLGNMGFSVRDQGANILINLFFNVAVNAAKGISNQIGTVINSFASNFTMAMNPQITKRYAMGEMDAMMSLLIKGCKFSLLLMSTVAVPLIIASETVLTLWLGHVAPYTVGFLRLVLAMALIDCVVSPITTALQASGKIKKFQILISVIMVSSLPVSWLWLKLDANPYIIMVVGILTSVVALLTRLSLLHEQIPFSYGKYFMSVYGRNIIYIFILSIGGWAFYQVCAHTLSGFMAFLGGMVVMIGIVAYMVGLNRNERRMVNDQFKKVSKKIGLSK